MHVLILSFSSCHNHKDAAEALKEYMQSSTLDCTVDIVDILKYISPSIDDILKKGHLDIIRNMPYIYGKLHNIPKNMDLQDNLNRMVNSEVYEKLRDIITSKMPDIVLTTHPFYVDIISSLKKKESLRIPVIALIMDFAPGSLQIGEHADSYVLPCRDVIGNFNFSSIDSEKIYPYGIPVRLEFLKKTDRASTLSQLGLENIPTVLIMGGDLGLVSVIQIFKSLVHSNLNIQIIAVDRNNDKLRRQMEYFSKGSGIKVKIFSSTDKLHDLMGCSDILITKPNGLVISQALLKQLPMAIISPVPGREAQTADFLINKGAAIKIAKPADAVNTIASLLNNGTLLEQMKSNMKSIAKPNSLIDITNLVNKLAQNSGYKNA